VEPSSFLDLDWRSNRRMSILHHGVMISFFSLGHLSHPDLLTHSLVLDLLKSFDFVYSLVFFDKVILSGFLILLLASNRIVKTINSTSTFSEDILSLKVTLKKKVVNLIMVIAV